MGATLLSAGIACIIAAIVGGGLKAFGIEIPALASGRRQAALGAFGGLLLVATVVTGGGLPWSAATEPSDTGDGTSTTTGTIDPKICLANAFKGLPAGRVRNVESGVSSFEVLPASESKDAPVAIIIEESRRPVAALEFSFFAGTEIFKISRVVDARCQPVETFRNSGRAGDKHVLENWDTVEINLGTVTYAVRLGYSAGAISASITRVG